MSQEDMRKQNEGASDEGTGSLFSLEPKAPQEERKPLPLGQAMMKKAPQRPIMEPSPEPQEAARAAQTAENAHAQERLENAAPHEDENKPKPIPLTARKTPPAQTPAGQPSAQPRPLKPVSAPRTFSEKEHAEMKERLGKTADKLKRPAKPAKSTGKTSTLGRLKDDSFGGMLQAARNRANMSVEQVEQLTRIKKSYLEALESDDIDNLPPRVFISAYIRTLSSVYNISPEDMEIVSGKLKELGTRSEVPEALIQNLEKDGQVSVAEEKRVRKILIGLVCAVILVILWGSGIYLGLKIKRSRDLAATEAVVENAGKHQTSPAGQGEQAPAARGSLAPAAFDSSKLERFVFQENPAMTELKVPPASARN